MNDDCYGCRTGEAPPKQPDVSIEEIEEDMRRMRSPSGMDTFTKWYNERPVLVQQAIRDFPPWQMYVVKDGAPYRFTCEGSIVSSLKWTENEKTGRVSTWFCVLRSPIGQAGVVAEIDPEYLEPITLDDLKKRVEEQSKSRGAELCESIIDLITGECTCPDPCHVHGGHGGIERPEPKEEPRVSAGELRALGVPLDDGIPDCATAPISGIRERITGVHVEGDKLVIDGEVVFEKPLEWVTFTFKVPEGVDAKELVDELNDELGGEVPVYGGPIFKEDGDG